MSSRQSSKLRAVGMQYLDLYPDPQKASCMSAWNRTSTASFLSDDAEWHHMAVTWTKQHNGRMRLFKDGLMMSEVPCSLITVQAVSTPCMSLRIACMHRVSL